MGKATTFLEGVRVLDLSRILAGPLATQTLGDMGAEVLKIERPGTGDDTRAWGPAFQGEQSAYFQSCNRNKASLALDLSSAAGHERLLELVRLADVCIDNFPPQVRERLGLSSAMVRGQNPRLITVSIGTFATGTGREDERGYDLAIQAESGWIELNGARADDGCKVGVAVIDVLCAHMVSNATLAALYDRERSGRSHAIEVSLFQTALFSLVNVATNHLVGGEETQRWGNAHPNLVPYQAFECRDARIVIAVGNDHQYRALCVILGLAAPWPGLSQTQRLSRRDDLVAAIDCATRSHESDALLADLRAAHVPCAPILRADQALHRVAGSLVALEHPVIGPVRTVAHPIVADAMKLAHTAPPRLDEGGLAMAQRWQRAAADTASDG